MQIIFNEANNAKNTPKNTPTPKQLNDMYRNLFLGSSEGQYILDDLAQKAGMFNISKIDSNQLHHTEGMRNLYLYIASHLTNNANTSNKINDYNPLA